MKHTKILNFKNDLCTKINMEIKSQEEKGYEVESVLSTSAHSNISSDCYITIIMTKEVE